MTMELDDILTRERAWPRKIQQQATVHRVPGLIPELTQMRSPWLGREPGQSLADRPRPRSG